MRCGFVISDILNGKTQILLANDYYEDYHGFGPVIKVSRCRKEVSGGTFLTYSYGCIYRGDVKSNKNQIAQF